MKTTYSYNWSGYAQSGARHGEFTGIKSYWSVPRLTGGANEQWASDWAGIDGYNNQRLVQTGTDSVVYGGQRYYEAWTEIIPADEVPAPVAVHPGNRMEGIVLKRSGARWSMTLRDLSTGRSYTRTVHYSTPGQSAEAIHERPEVGGSLANLAITNPVTYSSTYAQSGGKWRPLLHARPGETVSRIYMVNNADTAVIATPSAPGRGGLSFRVAYGPWAPSP